MTTGRPTTENQSPVTQAAIANAMGCSVRLVQILEQRALRKIRTAIETDAEKEPALKEWLKGIA